MAEISNCMLPDDLLYHVEYNVWVRVNDDGTVDLGMTDIAQTRAGSIIHCRPKRVGKSVKKGKSVATVESGKWVGPVKSPFAGEVVAVNSEVESDAMLVNRSPYKAGWIVRLRPDDFEADRGGLVTVEQAVTGFQAYLEENEIGNCIHCEGFEG